MIKLALRHGVGVAVVVLIVCIFGVLSLLRVPVQMTPDLSTTTVSVQTFWPGATPQDIEKEIVIEQEKYLKGIPNLDKMTATISTGRAEIDLEFRTGTNIEEILVRANNALSQVPSYPENVDQPRIVTSSASDQPIAWFSVRTLPGNPLNLDIIAMQDFLEDTVQVELERTPGVSQSQIFGGAARQVRVAIDPAKMAERGITVDELRAAFRARNRDISGGDFDEGKRRYLIRTVGRFASLREVEALPIARRDGTNVYLRDVGTVEMGRAEARAQVRHNGELALAMNVRRQAGTNIIEVMDEVKLAVERLNQDVLHSAGMYLTQVSDDTIYIREAVALVRQNLILGGILVTLCLLLFLRSGPTTLIGALAVPICTIAAFLGLTLAGRTINVISLAGVAFAIGMTVDNSIVVLENIYRHRTALRKPTFQAAYDGVREVWGAVLASTLTTAFVFLPIVFVQEEAGQLFADIAIAISAAIMCSMLVAITVIPSAGARLMGNAGRAHESALGRRFHDLFGLVPLAQRAADTLMFAVRWLMGGVLRRVVLVFAMASGALAMTFFLMPPTEYLPDGRQNLLFAVMLPPPGYNIDEMTRIGQDVEARFIPHVRANRADFAAGRTDVPPIEDFFFVATTQNVFVVTKTVEGRDLDALTGPLMAELRSHPGMIGFAQRRSIFSQGLSGSRGIDLDIRGQNLADIYQTALTAFGRINRDMEGAQARPQPGLVLGQPLLEVRPDWERAADLGVNAANLGYVIWAMTDGAYVDEFFLEDEKVDLYAYSTAGTVTRTQDLENLLFHTPQGGTVPLRSIARIVETVNAETIRRVDRSRAVTLSVVPPPSLALERAVEQIERTIIPAMRAEGQIPSTVDIRIAGASDKLKATREALSGNFLLAIAIAYLLMVALFSHWGYPLLIMTSLPLGVSGGLLGLHLMNHGGDYFGWFGIVNIAQPLDVLTMLGFVVLVGTVVNNPILIVEQSLQNMRHGGMKPVEAVIESTRTRIRPIAMSATTTTFGLSPLVFLPGSGTELYRGLGTVVLFGLAFSALFTLTFIPSLLSLFLQFGAWLHRKRLELTGGGDDDNTGTRDIAIIPDDEDEEETEANPQPAARTRLDPGSLPEPSGA
ncbi:MAG: efflux RND transporter permease subunit [Candidatus Sumerlaeia bacterium]|nr:efflux RND transporter permease subunit [Candidatus Sumerlaeia bacterium]